MVVVTFYGNGVELKVKIETDEPGRRLFHSVSGNNDALMNGPNPIPAQLVDEFQLYSDDASRAFMLPPVSILDREDIKDGA